MFLLDNLGYKGFELMYFIILFARNNSIAKLIHNGGGSALCGRRPGPGVPESGLWNPESWLLAPLVHSPRGPQINI